MRECLARGLAVRAAGGDPAALAARFPRATATRLDFLDRSTWPGALAGCDAVFLLRPPALADMRATLCPFVDAAVRAGVRHVVFLSVAGAERLRWVPHRAVEAHLPGAGCGWTLLRPGFFAQNLQEAYRRDIVEDGRLYVPAAQGRVAFVDVRDIAAVAAEVFTDPAEFDGAALTLTGPAAVRFDAVAGALRAALGRPVRYVPASVPGYAWHLRVRRGLPWGQIAVQTVLHLGLRRGAAERVDPTLGRLLGRLGRSPRGIEDYVRDHVPLWERTAAPGDGGERRRTTAPGPAG